MDGLMARKAFYAEFSPPPQYANLVDLLYVMQDRGLMTADRRTFASPLVEIAFLFASSGSERPPKVVVVEPSFGHREKKRPFHGWAFGIKCSTLPGLSLTPDLASFVPTATPTSLVQSDACRCCHRCIGPVVP
jgi:hypothetical protein